MNSGSIATAASNASSASSRRPHLFMQPPKIHCASLRAFGSGFAPGSEANAMNALICSTPANSSPLSKKILASNRCASIVGSSRRLSRQAASQPPRSPLVNRHIASRSCHIWLPGSSAMSARRSSAHRAAKAASVVTPSPSRELSRTRRSALGSISRASRRTAMASSRAPASANAAARLSLSRGSSSISTASRSSGTASA
mmetsp:Transcript_23939/g.71816  ORF Transcript_23939/g.71816 Transcript_23939/m.71816 type:complete len:200 (-) Transcript_23939:64-663(-)